MIKRIIEISAEPMHLSIRDGQLCLRRPGDPGGALVARVPCEDVGVLLVEHPRATFTLSAITRLAEHGAVTVFCGRDHLPVAVALPVSRNTEVVARLHDQIGAGKPVRKRLWKQLVVAKIAAQADNLTHAPAARRRLRAMTREVRSGDPANVEAQAARAYWGAWLTDQQREAALGDESKFRRDSDGDGLNALLNYGYAILRAGVARALVSGGLHPALGIHHSNRSNAFALADDLLEPLRPLADRVVQELAGRGQGMLDRDAKAALLGLLHRPVTLREQSGPLMVVLHRYTAGFLRCLRGQAAKLDIPRGIAVQET